MEVTAPLSRPTLDARVRWLVRRILVVLPVMTSPVSPAWAQRVEVRGTVVAFRTSVPMSDVELGFSGLSLTARSDSLGRFTFPAVPAGTHVLTARRIGYQAFEMDLRVGAASPAPLRVVLLPLPQVDSVRVVATPLTNQMLEFEENRRVGLGRFLVREQLMRYDGMKLGSALPQLPAVSLVRSGQRSLLVSRRSYVRGSCRSPGQGSVPGQPKYTPTLYEANRGVVCTCYAHVYVDGQLQNPGQPADPFDVYSLPIDDIEGVEWYAGPAQTPVQYARLNSACGVLVVHTRRAADRVPEQPRPPPPPPRR